MKSVAIITINDNNNYGNRLQNYAVQQTIKKIGNYNIETIKNDRMLNNQYEKNIYNKMIIKRYIRYIKSFVGFYIKNHKRKALFNGFNKNISYSKNEFKWNKLELFDKYDFYISGSDQVWNPTFGRMTDFELLKFIEVGRKIAFSASFGVNTLLKNDIEKAKNAISKFDFISVREDAGKSIIIKELGIEKNVHVLIDPTMLLSPEEWDSVSKKPKKHKENEKYILNYFLGDISEEWQNEIERVAKEKKCKIINILNKEDKYFKSGPSEFLYMEKNAFLVCTDSFHSSVFSILYDTPFVVFNRKDKHVSMNSRLDTLLTKFKLMDRKFKGKITENLLKCNYSNAKIILEKEREKSMQFLRKALDIIE